MKVLKLGTSYRTVVRIYEKKDSYLPYFEKSGDVIFVPAQTEVWLEKIEVLERRFPNLTNSESELVLKGYLPEPPEHLHKRQAEAKAESDEVAALKAERTARARAVLAEEEDRAYNRWWRRLWRRLRGTNLPQARLIERTGE